MWLMKPQNDLSGSHNECCREQQLRVLSTFLIFTALLDWEFIKSSASLKLFPQRLSSKSASTQQ